MKTFAGIFFFFPALLFAKVEVATTTTDLAALVRQVGQNQVQVFSIAKGAQDPHQIEAKPSFMVKLRKVDLLIAQGLELESAWIVPLIQGARNPKLLSKDGFLELAAELNPIEVVGSPVSRAEGDVHPGGNPHFQLDPVRLGQAAVLIAKRLGSIELAQREFFNQNAAAFQKRMNDKTVEWKARIKKSGVHKAVTYHKTFSYFCDRFEIQCSLQLEPKPGIPPTASHLLDVIRRMKEQNIRLVLIENLYEDSVAQKLKQEIKDVIVKRLPVAVEGEPGVSTNELLIEKIVTAFEDVKP